MVRVDYNERVSNGGEATSESDLFKYFHMGLRLMVNPNDYLHLNRLNIEFAPNEPYGSFKEISSAFGSYEGLSFVASDALRKAWGALSNSDSFRFDLALDTLRDLCGSDAAFSGAEDRMLAANDCLQWTKWWETYCLSSLPSSRSLSGFLRALSLGEVLDAKGGDGVTLSTVHLAKGLEFDVVFVIGLNDGTFPDYRARTYAQKDEERHSMYVAVTRSKKLCYVTRSKIRRMPWGDLRMQHPSPYFSELQMVN
jgi:DNA helicase-2/ATP-dependent DNA helicase PcrA